MRVILEQDILQAVGYARQDFRLGVCHSEMDPKLLRALFAGRIPALLVKNWLRADRRAAVIENYIQSPFKKRRQDGVSPNATWLGPTSYGLSPNDAVEDAANSATTVDRLFYGLPFHPLVRMRQTIASALNLTPRAAEYKAMPLGTARAARWEAATGEPGIRAHEDLSQIETSGLEVADVEVPVACNLYPEAPEEGGELRLYNIIPGPKFKRALSIEKTGYPVPDYLLADVESLVVDLEPGDLLLFNGALVHRVGEVRKGNRMNITFFTGKRDTDLLFWV